MYMKSIFSLNSIINKLFAVIIVIFIISSVLYVFTETYFDGYVLFASVLTVFLFILFDYIFNRKKIGGLLYILLLITILFIVYLIFNMQSGSNYSNAAGMAEWFFSGSEARETEDYYLLLTALLFTFFISSVIYYFTYVIYRTLFILVISLIPCALFVKVSLLMPDFYIIVIAAMNILIYIMNTRAEIKKEAVFINGMKSFVSYTDFAVGVLLLALLIPKPVSTPFFEKFEEFISRYTIGGDFNRTSGRFMRYSGNADNMQDMEDRTLYIVSTNNPAYYKVQVFNTYDRENRYWTFNETNTAGFSGWEKERAKLSLSDLHEAYKKVYELKPQLIRDYNMEGFTGSVLPEDGLKLSRIRTVNFPSEYLIAPMRAVNVSFSENSNAVRAFRTASGELFSDISVLAYDEVYSLEYYDDNYMDYSGWLESGGGNISFEDFGVMLTEMKTVLRGNGNTKYFNTVDAFEQERLSANIYRPQLYASVSDEIRMLSGEITGGLEYDWQKAEALERYFFENDFVYDLAYRAPEDEDTPEYFLFTSKRGTCSDFATAYCLMARAAGLTVRYTEGYVPVRFGSEGIYQIRTVNAHSYPEVYIAGAGWQIYEPTVPDLTGNAGNNNGNLGATGNITALVTALAVLISITILAVIIIIIPIITERLFRIKTRIMKNNGKAVILLMKRYENLLKRLFDINTENLTAFQTGCYSKSLTVHNIEALIIPFTDACYGGREISDEEKFDALNCYTEQYRLLKKRRRKDKKNGSFKYTDYSGICNININTD